MEMEGNALIPVEWVDADEWEAIEQSLAAATVQSHQLRSNSTSHSAGNDAIGVDLMACGRRNEQSTKKSIFGSVASETDVEASASEFTGSSLLPKDQLDAVNRNLGITDVESEMALDELNKDTDDHPKKLRRTLPAWGQKKVKEEISQVQAAQSQMKIESDQMEGKPVVVQTNLSQLTDSWSMARPACKDKMHSRTQYLQFRGRLVYSKTFAEVDIAIHDIWEMINAKRSILSRNVVVGFDLEWRTSFRRGEGSMKAAVLQLCFESSRCDVMHILHSGIPPSLATFLEDPSILKTGVGSHGDASKLQRDYGITTQGVVNLSEMANQKLGRCQSWSLSSLAQELTCKQVEKVKTIRCGNWESCPLSPPQLQYAATDAFASLYLYQILESFSNRVMKTQESSSDPPLMQQVFT